jgi:hypothetical protein
MFMGPLTINGIIVPFHLLLEWNYNRSGGLRRSLRFLTLPLMQEACQGKYLFLLGFLVRCDFDVACNFSYKWGSDIPSNF